MEVHYEAKGNVAPGDAYGQFTFGNITSQASGHTFLSTEAFNGVAALLMGIPTSGDQSINASYYITRPYYGFYAQDDWKVNNRLTLNIGLRYDVQLPYLERYNRMASHVQHQSGESAQQSDPLGLECGCRGVQRYQSEVSVSRGARRPIRRLAIRRAERSSAARAIHRLDQRGSAYRLCVSCQRQDRNSRRLRHVLPIHHQQRQLANRVQPDHQLSVDFRYGE